MGRKKVLIRQDNYVSSSNSTLGQIVWAQVVLLAEFDQIFDIRALLGCFASILLRHCFMKPLVDHIYDWIKLFVAEI